MHVLGTAGHVDHGKSTLVKALTGIDPDRLPEEKERGLTIELGFAWFETEVGPLGVVDVPGHEKFVRTMVAGAGGIDIVLLVVAADDGWMPQTQEHLDILRLLEIPAGIVVLSKCDLADPAWMNLVEDDIRTKTRGTFLEAAPIVRTDALAGKGLDELKVCIAQAQRATAEKQDRGRGRLAIDRVFTMAGQGTVVTGTLRDGALTKDQKVYLFPSQATARVRSLQTHKRELDTAPPGSRVAANLAGVEREEITRGMWLHSEPPCRMPHFVGTELSLVAQVPIPLKQGTRLLLIHGTSEVEARLNLPSDAPLQARARAAVQLELEGPMAGRFGDRFIVRLPTPPVTVAGGHLLEPSPHRYGKRHASQWQGLSRLAGGDYSGCIQFRLAHEPAPTAADLYPFFPGSAVEFEELLAAGAHTGLWERRGDRIVRAGWLAEKRASIVAQVRTFHKQNPSQVGPVSAELLSELPEDLHAALLRELESDGVRAEGPYLCHSSHRAGLTSTQEQLATAWRKLFDQAPFAGPTRPELLAGSAEARPTLEFLLKSGEFTELKDGVLLRTADFERAVHMIVDTLKDGGELTVAALRDALGATRKYALPILDRCDRLGYTRRVGDARVLGPRATELLKAKNP
jgi:selenocysteine-specific elongation factor